MSCQWDQRGPCYIDPEDDPDLDNYTNQELRTIAGQCNIPVTRSDGRSGYKSKRELCLELNAWIGKQKRPHQGDIVPILDATIPYLSIAKYDTNRGDVFNLRGEYLTLALQAIIQTVSPLTKQKIIKYIERKDSGLYPETIEQLKQNITLAAKSEDAIDPNMYHIVEESTRHLKRDDDGLVALTVLLDYLASALDGYEVNYGFTVLDDMSIYDEELYNFIQHALQVLKKTQIMALAKSPYMNPSETDLAEPHLVRYIAKFLK